MIRKLLITIVLAGSIGCARRHVTGLPDLVIPRACVDGDVVGHECRVSKDPVQCRSMSVKYKKDCTQVRVKGEKWN